MQEGRLLGVCLARSELTVSSTGSRFYLFKMDRDENNEIMRMKEVYSAECSPGIKCTFVSIFYV